MFRFVLGQHISEIISSFEKRSQSSDRAEAHRHHQSTKAHSPAKTSATVVFRRPATPGAELHKRPSSMVLPDHDSAIPYIQKYLDAVTDDSSKHVIASPASDSAPPAKKSNIRFDQNVPVSMSEDHFASERFSLELSSHYKPEQNNSNSMQIFENDYTSRSEEKSLPSETRKISSSSSSSHSSSSANGATDIISNSLSERSNPSRIGLPIQSLDEIENEPTVTSPDIPSLGERLIRSGHYQTPKSQSTSEDSGVVSPSMSQYDDSGIKRSSRAQNGFDSPVSDMHSYLSSDFVDRNRNVENENNDLLQNGDSQLHRDTDDSDMESDEDGPTSYEV